MGGGLDSTSSASNAATGGPIQVASTDKSSKRLARLTSLDVMRDQIEGQIESLPVFADKLRQENEDWGTSPSDMIFTGSGDSFAASLFAHYVSNHRSLAADPYELQFYPDLTKAKTVFITSVSGRTRANVQLARRIKSLAKKRIAITANEESPLARECDDLIHLPYNHRGPLTSGTVSFTLSLLAVASRITRLPRLDMLGERMVRAEKWARALKISPGGFLLVGSGIGYALSAYGAFKVHEILGVDADYEHTEQLGHSKLFSLQRTGNIIALAWPGDRKTREVSRKLWASGFYSQLLTSDEDDPVIAGLDAAFSFQQLGLTVALKRGLQDCAFLTDKKRLELSSQLIY